MNKLILRLLFMVMLCLFIFNSCAPIRGLRWWQPDLNDSSKFAKLRLQRSNLPFKFKEKTTEAQYLEMSNYLDTLLKNSNTNAFVIIKNDSIIYQNFADGITSTTKHASFSVAKSFVGTLIGIAVDQKIIHSTSDLVIKYIPELEKNDLRFRQLTIQHVLDMCSGLDFDENKETPFAGITKLYYGHSLKNQIKALKLKRKPGESFEYQSINTQLLAEILERASGEKFSVLMYKNLWSKIGAENDAIWSMDDQKTVKAFCCLNATAFDFAKLGRLYLNKGRWEDKQVVSAEWIEKSTNADTLQKLGYKNQWWACEDYRYFKDSVAAVDLLKKLRVNVPIKKTKYNGFYVKLKASDYMAIGILGQYIYVNPKNNVIIVRLGNYAHKNLSFEDLLQRTGRQFR